MSNQKLSFSFSDTLNGTERDLLTTVISEINPWYHIKELSGFIKGLMSTNDAYYGWSVTYNEDYTEVIVSNDHDIEVFTIRKSS